MIITLKICDVQIGKHLRPCKLSVYSGVGRDIIDKCAIWYVISRGQFIMIKITNTFNPEILFLEIHYIQRHSHHQSLLNHSHLHTLKVTITLFASLAPQSSAPFHNFICCMGSSTVTVSTSLFLILSWTYLILGSYPYHTTEVVGPVKVANVLYVVRSNSHFSIQPRLTSQ